MKSTFFTLILYYIISPQNCNSQIFVNKTAAGLNNGTSWMNAFSDLQLALDNATDIDTIWVAEGIYFPTESVDGSNTLNNRNKSFHTNNKNLCIYGGFNGSENLISQRNYLNHATIFSGDFNEDDIILNEGANLSISNNAENAYHIFVLSNITNLLLDGVQITGTNSNGSGSYIFAGQTIYDNTGSFYTISENNTDISIMNTDIYGNSGYSHGGFYSYSDSTSIINFTNCLVTRNYNNVQSSGLTALTAHGVSKINLSNCSFNGNKSTGVFSKSEESNSILDISNCNILNNGGSGISSNSTNSKSKITINNSTIENNKSSKGAGIYSSAQDTSYVEINYSKVNKNITSQDYGRGGGIFSFSNSNSILKINMSSINENTALYGGGIYTESLEKVSADLKYCTINSNLAYNTQSLGGGIYSKGHSQSNTNIENSTICNNNAYSGGGGIYSENDSYDLLVQITNCTFVDNFASNGRAVKIKSSFGSANKLRIKGSIIHNNGGLLNEFINDGQSSFYSLGYNIFGSYQLSANGFDFNSINASSLNLQPLDFNGGNTLTMIPGPGSIATNNGDPLEVNDAQNRPIIGGRRDIGAAEYNCSINLTDEQHICDSIFNWMDGNSYSANNNEAHIKFISTSGLSCDTLVTLNLTINEIDTSVMQNGNIFSSADSNATYQWLDCNNFNSPILGANNQTYVASENGNYAVTITKNGCSDTSSCRTLINVGFGPINDDSEVKLFPNPANDAITVTFKKNEPLPHTLIIYNLIGEEIYHQEIHDKISEINVQYFESGTYYIVLKNDLKSISEQLLIIH